MPQVDEAELEDHTHYGSFDNMASMRHGSWPTRRARAGSVSGALRRASFASSGAGGSDSDGSDSDGGSSDEDPDLACCGSQTAGAKELRRLCDLAGPLLINYMAANAMTLTDQVRVAGGSTRAAPLETQRRENKARVADVLFDFCARACSLSLATCRQTILPRSILPTP